MNREDKMKPLWRFKDRGTLMLRTHPTRIKPKEEVRLSQEQIAGHEEDFELLENVKGKYKVKKNFKSIAEVEEDAEAPEKDTYEVEVAGIGWYNVVSSDGKVMNETKLRAQDAEVLKTQLEEETIEQ